MSNDTPSPSNGLAPDVLHERQKWFYRRLMVFGIQVVLSLLVGWLVWNLGLELQDLWAICVTIITLVAFMSVNLWLYMSNVKSSEELSEVLRAGAEVVDKAGNLVD